MVKFLHQLPFIGVIFKWIYGYKNKSLEREVFGIKFPNPVGLAAGFDKDAKLVDELSNMGFGFIEIGTLTPKAQPGNDKPRLFRVKQDQGIINRMGFNNGGVEDAVQRLRRKKSKVIIGGNIGKNKVTPNEEAVRDYELCYESLYDVVDYFVVNVSSPNTPNLRDLQDKEPLKALLQRLQIRNNNKSKPKPILLKIAPDLTDGQLDDIVEIAQEINLDGLIATNTTISREGLTTPSSQIEKIGMGGLSGKPLTKRSTEVLQYLRNKLGADFPIISVGGIMSEQDALEKIQAGATLIQLYSGFIYEGPSLVKRINKQLARSK